MFTRNLRMTCQTWWKIPFKHDTAQVPMSGLSCSPSLKGSFPATRKKPKVTFNNHIVHEACQTVYKTNIIIGEEGKYYFKIRTAKDSFI